MLQVRVVLLLPGADGPGGAGRFPAGGFRLDEADLAAAKWSLGAEPPRRPRIADTLPGGQAACSCRCRPPAAPSACSASIGDEPPGSLGPLLTPDTRQRLLAALSGPGGAGGGACEPGARRSTRPEAPGGDRPPALRPAHLHLARPAHAARLHPGRGHQPDQPSRRRWTRPGARPTCCRTIQEEAERLNRFIGNLLDMTRLESGPLTAQPASLADLSDVLGAVLRRAARILAGYHVDAGRCAPGPADAADRHGAVRTGAVQPPRQRGEIRAAPGSHDHRRAPAAPGRTGGWSA